MTSSKPNPIPGTYRRVTPCLIIDGAAKALEFYGEVFGAKVRMHFPGPGGSVAHAEIEIGDSVVIVEDADPVRGTQAPPTGGLAGTPVFQFVYVADVDAARAIQTPSGSTVSTANDLADVLCAPGGAPKTSARSESAADLGVLQITTTVAL